MALSIDFPGHRVIFHGNAKTAQELQGAIHAGVGRIVVDSIAEIAHLAALVPAGRRQKILIRVIPDIEAGAHRALRAGGEGQKFGLSTATGAADVAVTRALAQRSLDVAWLHARLGSQICALQPYSVQRGACPISGRHPAHVSR